MRLEFPITRPYPRLWSLALCVFALCTLIVLFVINVPLAGYNLIQFTTRDWDFHQDMWWDPFIPNIVRSKARKCQATKISTGTRFRLDNDLFDWTIQKLMTREEGQPIQRNNTDFGVVTGWRTIGANETLEYENQPMSSCDLYGVFWKVNLREQSVRLFGDIMCDLPIPLIARTTYSAGGDPTTLQTVIDGTYYDREVLMETLDKSGTIPFVSIISAVLQYFGFGLISDMTYMFRLANGSYPATVAGYLVNPDWCPVSFFGRDPACRNDSSAQPRFRWGMENVGFDNLTFKAYSPYGAQSDYSYDTSENTTYSPTIIFSPEIKPAIFNLMNAFVSAIRTDIGGARANNMFQSREAMSAQIYSNEFEELFAPQGSFTSAQMKDQMINDPEERLPIPEAYHYPTRMVINYLCTKQELKRGAVLVFNVAVAAFALFGTVWAITGMIASMALQQRRDWKGTSGVCLGHSQGSQRMPDSSYVQQQYFEPLSPTPGYSAVKEQTPFFSSPPV